MKRFKLMSLCVAVVVLCAVLMSDVVRAGDVCVLPKPVAINVMPRTSKVEYDYSRSLADLQAVDTDTVDPYGLHSNSITQGFMEGQISMKRDVHLDYKTVNRGQQVCLWYKGIDIHLHIDQKIVLAREIRRDSCMRKAVLNHEQKHVDVDRDVVNAAAQRIGAMVYKRLAKRGFVVGPLPVERAQKTANAMVAFVMDLMQEGYDALVEERAVSQAAVDTMEEYEHVKAQCPDFYKGKKRLYRSAVRAKQRALEE